RDGEMVLATYGKSTGFCIDPIEKKPLHHFYPGTAVLSFGTAGCNLGCKFCQNWDISKSREVQRLSARAEPETIAHAARETGCRSVAFTYNDPVVWAEYAIDTARACRAADIRTVAVTAGYICPQARGEFFAEMDAANIDLKAFTEDFYHKITYSHLQPVLETIEYLKRETDVWFELTNLVIPGLNDDPDELRRMCDWILQAVGDEVPVHFSAFHPDFRLRDRGPTPPETLDMAYDIARAAGLKYPYVGNTHNVPRQSTHCPHCGRLLIERDWYQLGIYALDEAGRCRECQAKIPGHFDSRPGQWGATRRPIHIEDYATNSIPQFAEPPPEVYALKDVTVTSTDANAPSSSSVASSASVSSKPLQLAGLSAERRQIILKMASNCVAQAVTGQALPAPPEALEAWTQSMVMGVFVTLKRGDVLRGCCGVLGKPMPLAAAVASAANRTARDDQRMAPISPCELAFLNIDVTLLGPFTKIEAAGTARAETIQIGKHGLLVQRGQKNGLLLPSVAVERKWGAVRFLQAVCGKAGLPSGAWESEDTTVMRFDGETLSSPLAEQLPINLPNERELPLTAEQVAAYAQVAGQNISALVTGGTPSYVVPHLPDLNVNAIVLSMQWGSEEHPEEIQQGSALQVSFRPGVALQSTLYQMCQQAAAMFQQQRFNGQVQVGLSLGFDPAMHGQGVHADLQGVDPAVRALVISDKTHCGFGFDPEKSIEELQEQLRQRLPISSRDASVYTLHMLSTLPSVICVSGPSPLPARGVRPAAVAGKFYPAEDAARRALVADLLPADEVTQCQPLAVMVPHAGLKYSGRVAANVWRRIENLADQTLIIISPKHTHAGVNWSVSPFDSWQLSKTLAFASDSELAQRLCDEVDPLQLDAAAHQNEHGIEVQLPLLEKLAPTAKVVGLALQGGSWEDIQAAAKQLAGLLQSLTPRPLLVISSDMNHFANDAENRRLDRLALDALNSGDPQRLLETCTTHEISMCGLVPAVLVLETLRQLGQPFHVEEVDYATSAEISGDKSRVVGYAGALIVAD
ncbi:MAG: AmmeMemoRadiSam system radical SAM enzyme, partial [Planctomycetales bacterium]|nr:AmmeMemoRadiSam system radical SAM enzyme [Planctomycetales bacterium]